MIDMNGVDYTRDKYGSLRLANITVDGTAPGDRAAAPVIVDWGRLTLGEGVQVTANYNYGTSGNEDAEIPEYGGGICVYRELILEDHGQPSVTGNYADLLGGGIYLERNAELWLYGDVIKDNMVKAPESEHGLDLFARPYSKIHYNRDVFTDIQNWPTFYLSKGVILLPIGEEDEIPEPEAGSRKEIFITVSKDSGYSAKELLELKQKLQAKGYIVISNHRTEIDTTDLRNWNVYDHYDTSLWPGGAGGDWGTDYAEYRNRPYYAYTESFYNTIYSNPSTPPATTIADWLTAVEKGYYTYNGALTLACFKEHIYSREEDGKAAMTFVGYGRPAYKDFCYIDPHSGGEKVVSFDVDSSKVNTHTLAGTGFLINTGEENGVIKGYLVYYTYTGSGANARANGIYLYRLKEGVTTNDLHHAANADISNWADLVDSKTIASWDTHMSIKIKVTPEEVKVWQQSQTGEEIDESTDAFFSYELEDTGYSGYGPLVAYGPHSCYLASSFTYSNLYMYFTDPTEEERDMMSPLAEADFTQTDTQKYFVNLFGEDNLEYGDDDFRQYQGYLQMMQEEGIAMITDRDTPFKDYLGSADDPQGEHDPGNLKKLDGGRPGNKLEVDELVDQIDEYLSGRKSTSLKETVGRILSPAEPGQSVGNIWLQSEGEQFRALDWSGFDGTERMVQIMDDISCYNGDNISVLYEILRPGKSGYITLSEEKQPTFKITKNRVAWPEGPYTVRQTIIENGKKCAIKGYAYFNLEYPPQFVDPVTTVKVTARLNGNNWAVENHGKRFMLRPVGGSVLVDPSLTVPGGEYTVCEVIKLAADGTLEEGVDTGVSLNTVNVGADDQEIEAFVDYYTVEFYDAFPGGELYGDETKWAQQIVLKGTKAAAPENPEKDKYSFAGWVTKDGSPFAIEQTDINEAVELHAKWLYPVKVTARLDGNVWAAAEHGKRFMLRPDSGGALIELSGSVPDGKYTVCEVVRLAEDGTLEEGVDTGVLVDTANVSTDNQEIEAFVDYYTVTFYDAFPDGERYEDDTDQAQQIVLKGGRAVLPAVPEKEQYSFAGWVTDDGSAGGKEFNFGQTGIDEPVRIYAKWEKIEEPRYKVEIKSQKDGDEWKDAGRRFVLLPESGDNKQFVFDLEQVKKGTYRIYDKTGVDPAAYGPRAVGTDVNVKVDDGDTGITVTVENKDETASVDYYTVTFYDGKTAYGMDTPQRPTIILSGKKAAEPSAPDKRGHQFTGWMTENNGSTAFDFDQTIRKTTKIYAGWKANRNEDSSRKPGEESTPDDGGGEDTQTVRILQTANGPTAGVTAPDSSASNEKEPKTNDPTRVEIYATVAMVAGLTYLLLYFMEESRGMSEREKEVFVAAFIRWAKKGGRFRKCCAIVAIFCLLVYYHSIGKYAYENMLRRECLKQL